MKSKGFAVVSIDAIICFSIFIISFFNFFPPVRGYFGNAFLIITSVFNLFILYIAISYQGICFANRNHAILTILFFLYSTIIPVLMGNNVWANRYISLLPFITFPLLYNLLRKRGTQYLLMKYIKIMYLAFMFVFAATVYYLLTNPYLVRGLKSTGSEADQFLRVGVGGYDFIYSFVLIGVLSYQLLLIGSKRKLLNIAMLICSFILVVMSNYMTALVFLVLGCMMCLVAGRSLCGKLFIMIVGLIIIFIAGSIMSVLKDLLSSLSSDGRISRLLLSNESNVLSTIYTEFLADRFPTLLNSITVMIKYNFLGAIWGSTQEVLETLGQHSHILDTFALMGIPFGLIYFYVILRNIYSPIPFVMTFLGILFFNNASPTLAYVFYILVPILLDLEASKKDATYRIEETGLKKWGK